MFNSILKHHPEEWLLLFDLLDIANLNNYKKLHSQIKAKILLSTNNQNISSIIKEVLVSYKLYTIKLVGYNP